MARWLALALVVAGCSDGKSYIHVSVTGLALGVNTLTADVENAGEKATVSVPVPSGASTQDFSLELKPERSGAVVVTVQATGSEASLHQQGMGTVDLIRGGTAELTIALSPVVVTGDGGPPADKAVTIGDMAETEDLAEPVEDAASTDEAEPADYGDNIDLVELPDATPPADLVSGDLTVLDLIEPPDLEAPPDLVVPPDLTVLDLIKPDLTACVPKSCKDRQCGDDGCGMSCGSCAAPTVCYSATWRCAPNAGGSCGSTTGLSGSPWPMPGKCPTHQGRTTVAGPPTSKAPSEAWKHSLGTAADAFGEYPVVGFDGTVLVGTYSGVMHAVTSTGALRWSYSTSGAILHAIVTSDYRVHFGSRNGKIYCVNYTNGALATSYSSGSSILGGPSFGAGKVLFGTESGTVFALTYSGGAYSLAWKYQAGSYVRSAPATSADGKSVYFGSHDKYLHAVDAATGKGLWKFPAGNVVEASPAIGADGTIYFGDYNGRLHALKPDGAERWSYYVGIPISGGPAIAADGTVVFATGNTASGASNYIISLYPDGKLRWRQKITGAAWAPPAIDSAGTIFLGTRGNLVYAFASDGTPKWTLPQGGPVPFTPAIGKDGTLYVAGDDKYLHAYR